MNGETLKRGVDYSVDEYSGEVFFLLLSPRINDKIVVEFENILDRQNVKKKKNVKMSKTRKEILKQTEKRKK